MQIFLTVVTGFATYALGQIAVKLLIDPVQDFNRVVADIAHVLIESANVYANPGVTGDENEKKASEELRKLSSRLYAQMHLVPAYAATSKLFGLPSKEEVAVAAKHLIGLSNGFGASHTNLGMQNAFRAQHVRDALGIFVAQEERLDTKLEAAFYK